VGNTAVKFGFFSSKSACGGLANPPQADKDVGYVNIGYLEDTCVWRVFGGGEK
jgi:hypothetical protein